MAEAQARMECMVQSGVCMQSTVSSSDAKEESPKTIRGAFADHDTCGGAQSAATAAPAKMYIHCVCARKRMPSPRAPSGHHCRRGKAVSRAQAICGARVTAAR